MQEIPRGKSAAYVRRYEATLCLCVREKELSVQRPSWSFEDTSNVKQGSERDGYEKSNNQEEGSRIVIGIGMLTAMSEEGQVRRQNQNSRL